MMNQDHMCSMMAAATISPKSVNQDAFALVRNANVPLSAVVVADGLGSQFGAEVSSSLAVATIAERLGAITSTAQINMEDVFRKSCELIGKYVTEHTAEIPPDVDVNNSFGTTALCAVEIPDNIILSYVGNGALFHVRGDFNTFPASQLLPWSSINYLNPHAVPSNGKNLLYKLLSPQGAPVEAIPTVITLSKDKELLGDIIVAVTDGVYSYDQVKIGRDEAQDIWINGEPAMALLYQSLGAFFEGPHSEEALQLCLQCYLTKLASAGRVSDDCTVAVLITAKALQCQGSLRAARSQGAVQ